MVIKAFAPLLGTDRARTGPPGRIVNISSVGGRFAAPFVGLYAASKHGLEGLSQSLRRELMLFGIDVIIVAPGSVATPIWDKAEQIDLAPYQKSPYFEIIKRFRDYMIAEGRKGWSSERLGEVVCEALTAARPKTRYSPVAGRFQNWTLPTTLPARVVDRIVAKTFGHPPFGIAGLAIGRYSSSSRRRASTEDLRAWWCRPASLRPKLSGATAGA